MSGAQWEEFVKFARSRPPVVQELMREWPPLAVVKTKPGVALLVPAPGVEATVVSYYEDGCLGVAAPLTIPHPVHGWGSAGPGEVAKAKVDPAQLVLVREGDWTREQVVAALDAGASS